jgi:zinc transport system substrate-binding protein
MRRTLLACAAFSLGLSMNTQAAPAVAVDIAPLHSLVSQVMEGIAQPKLLIPAEASPHHYTLRPSEAKALASAEIVFWMGESYTPWLEKAMNNIAGTAQKVEALELENITTHAYREGATFESHDHDDEHHGEEKPHKEDHHGREEHDKHQHHDDHNEHKQHADHHEHQHDHEGKDPHAWLDPENAKAWLNSIRDTLSKQDPANAQTYQRNAAKATSALNTLIQSTSAKVNALGALKFIVFHDAYQYFEKRFNIPATGSISLGHAEDPSPARIKEIRETVKKLGVTCVFTEPQYNPGIVKAVFEGSKVTTIGVMDPLGAHLPTGSKHYPQLIEGMVDSLSQCQ